MRKVSILIGICMLVGVALAQAPADLDAVMKEVGMINGGLQAKIMANDAAGVAADAARLEALFKQAEDFFAAKKITDGTNWAAETKAAASTLAKTAKGGDMAATKTAAASVAKNCKSCHAVYRQQDPTTKAFSYKAPQ